MKQLNIIALTGVMLLTAYATPGYAVNGHYVGGLEGSKGPVVPPAGWYYRGYLVHYDIDDLQDPQGDRLPGDNTGSVTAFANRLIFMTDYQFLGADYGMEAIVTVQENDFDFSIAGIDQSESGIGDVFLGPLILGWHGQQYDAVFGAGYWFDVGDYDATSPASVGKGFGTTMLTLGGSWYFDPARRWSVSALSRYEIKTRQEETGVTPGDSWIVEWALGHVLDSGVEVALAGYDGWQLDSDSGRAGTDKVELHAVGGEVTFGLRAIGAQLSGAIYSEYGNKNRPEGNLFRVHLTKAF